mgnify:FL=1
MSAAADTLAPAPDALFGVERSLGGKRWVLSEADETRTAEIARAVAAPDALARLLAARGVTAETAQGFLTPKLRDSFPDPTSVTGVTEAAALILDALKAGKGIAVFADYDVDGATSAAQLSGWLRACGGAPMLYVPDRIEEGFGPNPAAFDRLKARGAELVVTLDCGAAAEAALAHAAEIGLEVVVIDHHLMDGDVPAAAALVNPNQPGDASGCGHMAAAGVTFVLLAALNAEARRRGAGKDDLPDLMSFLDLAALGTVCDVVPLTAVNRAIVSQGLRVMSAWRRPGLAALARAAGFEGAASVYAAGFLLGPRINAGGRVGRSDLGARLLSGDDAAVCEEIAAELDRLNAERKAIEAEVLDAAGAALELQGELDAPVLVAAGEGWHPGVIGIAAGRLKERFNRPAIVIGIDPETGEGKGSGRSVSGVDLGRAVSAARAEGLLIAGGGHAMACGLTVEAGKIDALRAFLNERLAEQWDAAHAARRMVIDAALGPAGVTFDLWRALEAAGPFGAGHPEPRFACADLVLSYAQRVGANHVRFTARNDAGASVSGISFRTADEPIGQALLSGLGQRFHFAGRIRGEDGRFGRKAELHLEDLAPAGGG